MQLLLSFVQEPSQREPTADVWPTLQSQQRNETLEVLARLLAKTVTTVAVVKSPEQGEERHDD
jgi:hypothetical protein